jgi:replicative DNA helicase
VSNDSGGSDLDDKLPWDMKAEQATLGGMLLAKDAIAEVDLVINADDFYRPAHQIIYEIILDLDARGLPTDSIAVVAELCRTGKINVVGGGPYVHTLIATVPTAANAAYYAKTVRECAILRRMISAGQRITQFGHAGDIDVDELVDRCYGEVNGIADAGAPQSAIWLKDVFWPTIESLMEPLPPDEMTVPYGDLRRLIPSLRAGQVICVAARPGIGKSVVLGDFVRHVGMKLGLPVAWFSLEMPREELIIRTLAAEARVKQKHLQQHTIGDDELARLNNASERFAECEVMVDDYEGASLNYLRGALRRMCRIAKPKLVVIDYTQLMDPGPGSKNRSREQEVAEIARGLKRLAKEFGVCVIMASQLNRKVEERHDKTPNLADLRESGEMEQSSDIVILLYREDYYDKETSRIGEMDLIVAKHRGGETGTVTIVHQLEYARCVDMGPDDPTSPSSGTARGHLHSVK